MGWRIVLLTILSNKHHGNKHAARYEKSFQCSTDTQVSSDNASSFHAVKSIPFDSVHGMPTDYLCSQLTELRKLRSTGEFNTFHLENLRYNFFFYRAATTITEKGLDMRHSLHDQNQIHHYMKPGSPDMYVRLGKEDKTSMRGSPPHDA